MTRNATMKNTA